MPGLDTWCRSVHVRTRWKRRYRWLPQKRMSLWVLRGCFELKCWYVPLRGLYPEWSRRSDQSDRPPVVYRTPEIVMKKRTGSAASSPGDGPSHLAPLLTKNLEKLPNLVLHCCVTKYDDGDPRVPGWLSVRTQGSAWVVTLKDPDTATQMQCLGNTLDDALALADLMAGSEDAPWEIDQWAKRMGAKKSR